MNILIPVDHFELLLVKKGLTVLLNHYHDSTIHETHATVVKKVISRILLIQEQRNIPNEEDLSIR